MYARGPGKPAVVAIGIATMGLGVALAVIPIAIGVRGGGALTAALAGSSWFVAGIFYLGSSHSAGAVEVDAEGRLLAEDLAIPESRRREAEPSASLRGVAHEGTHQLLYRPRYSHRPMPSAELPGWHRRPRIDT